jgi:hypothetical protein
MSTHKWGLNKHVYGTGYVMSNFIKTVPISKYYYSQKFKKDEINGENEIRDIGEKMYIYFCRVEALNRYTVCPQSPLGVLKNCCAQTNMRFAADYSETPEDGQME